MSDLRRAAELALKALEELRFANAPFLDEAMEALRQALAQPEQECIYPECETGIGCDGPCGEKPVDTVNTSQERVDEIEKRRHEPGLWVVQYKDRHEFVWGAKPVFRGDTVLGLKPLYTAPPKRKWKGLTSDDKHFLLANAWNKEQAFDGFMDSIDKFLEEKNT
jgi:hypothetical protein